MAKTVCRQRRGHIEDTRTVVNWSNNKALCMMYRENSDRENPNPMDEAKLIKQIIKATHKKQSQIAIELGMSESALSNRLRVHEDAVLRKHVEEGRLTFTGAVASNQERKGREGAR